MPIQDKDEDKNQIMRIMSDLSEIINEGLLFIIVLLMGKGQITIINEDENVEKEKDIADKKVKKEKLRKLKKDKKDKRKKNKNKNNPAPIEIIYDRKEQQEEEEEEEEEDYDDEEVGEVPKEKEKVGRKTIFSQRVKLRHLAICFPDSILEIPQSSTLRAYFISEVARISSIFKVDEIVVLKDHGYTAKSEYFNPAEYIVRNLQYLETPQYMRKHLFKMHADLKNAGLMNPIECHHHLKTADLCQFREGVTVDRPTKKGAGSWVDIGLKQQAQMDVLLVPNTRVTLRVKDHENTDVPYFEAQAVSRRTPRVEQNLYWGYDVRIANNLKAIVEQGDYDIKILCNHHEAVEGIPHLLDFDNMELEDRSVMIFFSGTDDLSRLIERDEQSRFSVEQAIKLFDYSLKFENFGVQKLRVEEQLFMSLQKMSKFLY